jgi:hypothetical protein
MSIMGLCCSSSLNTAAYKLKVELELVLVSSLWSKDHAESEWNGANGVNGVIKC